MIVTLIVVTWFVFKAPAVAVLSVPICLVYLILKYELFGKRKRREVFYYDEFDWWQDNQGF